MKKLILGCIIMFASNVTNAQTDTLQLERMKKVDLADVYLKEVQRVSQKLAYVTFDTISHSVPTTKYTQAKFERVSNKMDAYNKTLILQFMEIIPYADKKDIIKSILYLRSL